MLEATPFQLNPPQNALVHKFVCLFPRVDRIFARRAGFFPHDMIDSHIRGLPWFSSPRKVHLIWTEGFATVEEVLDIDFKVGAVGELLHHPC